MSIYVIGDVQGCDAVLARLLDHLDFSPSRDRLYFLGDLVNRGPDSLAVLRRIMGLEGSAHCVLGNHDLHLLAVSEGLRPLKSGDTFSDILSAADRDTLLHWLRCQPLIRFEEGLLMVHAGLLPAWTRNQSLALGEEVQQMLSGPDYLALLSTMYGSTPTQWQDSWHGAERWRTIINAMTRLRYCMHDGHMEFATKCHPDEAPKHLLPWFALPHRASKDTPIAFGHWSALGLHMGPSVWALDTGCVWGGALTALCWDKASGAVSAIQMPSSEREPVRISAARGKTH